MKQEKLEELQWIYLESTDLNAIAYDNVNLYVVFENQSKVPEGHTKVYWYYNVPNEVYENILNRSLLSKQENVPSHGGTFFKLIKEKGDYEYGFGIYKNFKY